MKNISAIPEAAIYGADMLGINIGRLRYLNDFLQKLVDNERHAFVAFQALRRGVKIFGGSYGVSAPGGSPLTGGAIFPMMSISKPFVATGCAILQELGFIDFWEPVSKYFAEFAAGDKQGVLLWHLLCHVSGMSWEMQNKFADDCIKNELGIALADNASEDERLDAYMSARDQLGLPKADRGWGAVEEMYTRLSLKAPLARAPGTRFEYSDRAYMMLGEIIEQLSGKSLEQFLKANIFDPLGMRDTHFVLPEGKRARFVTRDPSYRSGEYLSSDYLQVSTNAAGGLKSTMDDMLRFGQMFAQNGTVDSKRIISPASVRLMTTDQNETIPDSYWRERLLGSNWGFGWDVKNGKKDDLGMLRSDRSYNHGGFGGARIHVDPDADLVVSLYMVEQFADLSCDDQSTAMNVLYSALD